MLASGLFVVAYYASFCLLDTFSCFFGLSNCRRHAVLALILFSIFYFSLLPVTFTLGLMMQLLIFLSFRAIFVSPVPFFSSNSCCNIARTLTECLN